MEIATIIKKTNEMEWEERVNEHTGQSYFRKMLLLDDETGVRINLAMYPAGTMIPLHDHPCGHGMYVLEGTLKTTEGEFGPGSFVWFPEGIIAEHGATQSENVDSIVYEQ